ncbi:MAG: hypothetical protein VX414_04710, partial [Candidatus Thermoplasmatota archaeon]|nr:hypothetical protein [Candidatus Thermoplasmatota archaeon]
MVRSSQYKNKIDTHNPNTLRFLGKGNIIKDSGKFMQSNSGQKNAAFVLTVMVLLVSLSSMMSMSEVELENQTRNYTSSDTGSAIQYTAS